MPVTEIFFATALMYLAIGAPAKALAASSSEYACHDNQAAGDQVLDAPAQLPWDLPSDDDEAGTPIIVTGDGPIAHCCPVDATEVECRAYLANDLNEKRGQCSIWQRRDESNRQPSDRDN